MPRLLPYAVSFASLLLAAPGCFGERLEAPPVPPAIDDAAVDAGHHAEAGGSPIGTFDAAPLGPYDDGALNPCGRGPMPLARPRVRVMVALDGDVSAASGGKWSAVKSALDTELDAFASAADPSLEIGLLAFGDTLDPTCAADAGACAGPYPSPVDVPIAAVDAAQRARFHARLDGAAPASRARATRAALDGAFAALGAAPARNAVLLVSDGAPADGAACVQDTSKAQAAGVETHVIALGPFPSSDAAFDPTFFGRLAAAGGSGPKGCDPNDTSDPARVCHHQIDPAQSTTDAARAAAVVDAIEAARGALTCRLAMPQESFPFDPTKLNVEVTGADGINTILPRGFADGWDFDNLAAPAFIELHGSACRNYAADPRVRLTLLLGCNALGGP